MKNPFPREKWKLNGNPSFFVPGKLYKLKEEYKARLRRSKNTCWIGAAKNDECVEVPLDAIMMFESFDLGKKYPQAWFLIGDRMVASNLPVEGEIRQIEDILERAQ